MSIMTVISSSHSILYPPFYCSAFPQKKNIIPKKNKTYPRHTLQQGHAPQQGAMKENTRMGIPLSTLLCTTSRLRGFSAVPLVRT